MKDFLNSLLPQNHTLRLFYHKLLAVLAAFYYGFPAKKMTIIAVTGTKGKSTTCNIIHKIFTEAGKKTGLVTTINFKIGDKESVNLTKQTTPGPFMLQKLLKKMLKENCESAVIEVTSHSIIQSRIWGINIDTAVFTNLAHDHLDYHGSMEEYRNAKGLLFKRLYSSPRKPGVEKISVINADDPEHDYFEGFPVDQLFTYGIQKGAYSVRNIELNPNGSHFQVKIPNGEVEVDFQIPGRMNVYNALAAATTAIAHKINLEVIRIALEKMQPIPGRIEVINEGQSYTTVVDFAHTADSMEQVLSMFKPITKGKLICVFGCTGDRDKTKRPIMGAIADKYSDMVILTDDDPFMEDHKSIAKMVREGINRREGENFWQVLDRREAIRLALTLAKEGDSVLILGKGAEEFQVVGHKKIPSDDRKIIREILSRTVDIDVPHYR